MYELLKFEKSFNYRSIHSSISLCIMKMFMMYLVLMYGCFVIYFVNLMFAIKEDIEIILLF